jgi:antitoxin ParD1/3/4
MAHVIKSKESEEIIDGFLESGQYQTSEEVIKTALNQLSGTSFQKLQRLKELIDEGENSGDPIEIDEHQLLAEIKAELNV